MKTRQCFNKLFTALWLCVILSAIPVMSFSQQEYFYTYDGKKIYLDIATDRFIVQPVESVNAQEINNWVQVQFPDSKVREVAGNYDTNFFKSIDMNFNYTTLMLKEQSR